MSARRDPQTGQFVSTDAEDVVSAAYEDFDVQWLSNRVDVQSDMSTGNHLIEPWQRAEPLGGLTRDELAELVAFEVDAVVDPRGDAGTNSGKVQMRGELSLDSTAHLCDLPALGTLDENIDGVTGLDRASRVLESEPDIVDVWTVRGSERADATNGLGFTGDREYYAFVPLRARFGRGPVLDRHSEVFLHIWVELMSSGQPDIWQDVRLVWDVFDR